MRPIDADEAAATAKRLGMEVPWSTRTVLLLLDATPTITQCTVEAIPNNPLTLEELREMGGGPVWVDFPKCPEASGWMLVSASRHCIYDGLLGDCDFENCGKTWLAYRRKPEEGTNAAT